MKLKIGNMVHQNFSRQITIKLLLIVIFSDKFKKFHKSASLKKHRSDLFVEQLAVGFEVCAEVFLAK